MITVSQRTLNTLSLMSTTGRDVRPRRAPSCDDFLLIAGLVHDRIHLVLMEHPVTHLNRDVSPAFIIHGERDDVVSVEYSTNFRKSITANGSDSTSSQSPKVPHDYWKLWREFEELVIGIFVRML